MTREELAQYNGQNGQPAYVAVGKVIYDVSASPLWNGGNHEGAHQAGGDLSLELKSAPHVAAVVERFPVVGRLDEQPASKPQAHVKLIIAASLAAALMLAWILLR